MTEQTSGYDKLLALFYEYSPFFARGSEKQVAFYVEETRRIGEPVLELGSATGLYTVPIARTGLEIHALDVSEDMTAALSERLTKEPDDVRAHVTQHQDDMRSFRIDETFRSVIMAGNALLALPTARDQLLALRNALRHMHNEGRLVLDVFAPNLILLSQRSDYSWCEFTVPTPPSSYLCHRYRTIEPLRQALRVRYIHERIDKASGESRQRHLHQLDFRYVFPSELTLLLQLAGFSIEAMYGGFESRTPKSTYEGHTVVIAKKR